jgi:hypothetical protein
MTTDNIIHVITALIGIGGIIGYIAAARRVKSQNSLDISTAWEKFSKPLMERLAQLEKRAIDQDHMINDLRDWATRLYRQALDHGIKRPEQFIRHKRDGGDDLIGAAK